MFDGEYVWGVAEGSLSCFELHSGNSSNLIPLNVHDNIEVHQMFFHKNQVWISSQLGLATWDIEHEKLRGFDTWRSGAALEGEPELTRSAIVIRVTLASDTARRVKALKFGGDQRISEVVTQAVLKMGVSDTDREFSAFIPIGFGGVWANDDAIIGHYLTQDMKVLEIHERRHPPAEKPSKQLQNIISQKRKEQYLGFFVHNEVLYAARVGNACLELFSLKTDGTHEMAHRIECAASSILYLDGSLIIGEKGTLARFDLDTAQLQPQVRLHDAKIVSLAFA